MVEKDFEKYITSLKETSKDNHDNQSIFYITESNIGVINFDDVKSDYVKPFKISKPPSSNDALFKDNKTGDYYFIEFKAGGIDPMKNVEIKFKIYDSLLIFLDIIERSISFSRKKVHYILVYDENKPHKSQHYNQTDNKSKKFIQDYLSLKSRTEFIRFDLEKYKGLYFKDVHTYSFEVFEEKFVDRFSAI